MKFTKSLSVIAKKALTVMAVSTIFLSSVPLNISIAQAEENNQTTIKATNSEIEDTKSSEQTDLVPVQPLTKDNTSDKLSENEQIYANTPIENFDYRSAIAKDGSLIEWKTVPNTTGKKRSKRDVGSSGSLLRNDYDHGRAFLQTYYITINGQTAWCVDPERPAPQGSVGSYVGHIDGRDDLTNILLAAEEKGWTGSDAHYVNVWAALLQTIPADGSLHGTREQFASDGEVKYLLDHRSTRSGAFYHAHMDQPAEKTATWTKVNGNYMLETPMYFVRSEYPGATFTFTLPGQYASKLAVVKSNGEVLPAGNTVTLNANEGFKIRASSNDIPRQSIRVTTNVRNKTSWVYDAGPSVQRLITLGYDNPLTTDFAFNFTKDTIPAPPVENGSLYLKKVDGSGRGLAGATFKVSYNGTSKTVTSQTTPVLVDDELPIGTRVTIEEISAPDGYVKSYLPQTVTIDEDAIDNPVTVTFTNYKEETPPPVTPDQGELWLMKLDENEQVLSGAKFRVTGTDGTNKVVTIEGGAVQAAVGAIGTTYTVTEIEAPNGYILDPTPKTYTIDKSTFSFEKGYFMKFVNRKKPKVGSLYLKKQDLSGNSLNGAKFEVTINGQRKEYTVNGRTLIAENVPVGTQVTIREIQAPNGFQRTLESKTITIDESTAENAPEVIFTNKPQKGKLLITKEDIQTAGQAQGAATLNGAVYELHKKADDSLVETITFDGRIGTAVDLALGDYYLKEVKAPKGYVLDPTPIPVSITAASQDSNDNIIRKTVKDQVIAGSIKGYKYGNKSLMSKFIDLLMNLRNLGVETEDEQVVLEGVELTATSKTTGKTYKAVTDKNGYFEINNLPYDTYTLTETKGKTGYRLIEPFDFTIDGQGQIKNYTLVDKAIENKIKVVKKDKETGKVIPRANAVFKIYDRVTKKYVAYNSANGEDITELFTTDNTGTFTTNEPLPYGKDRYELHEVLAPEGYIREKQPVVFSVDTASNDEIITVTFLDNSQKGQATIIKEIENIASFNNQSTIIDGVTYEFKQPTMNFINGQGFQFKVRARENIITNDGTTRMTKGQYVQKDGKDLILTTNAQGKASTDADLYLGKYEFIEITAPVGYHLDSTPIPFELKYAGQDVQVATSSATKQNLRTVESFEATFKQEEIATGFKDKKAIIETRNATGKVFGLYAAEDVTIGSLTLAKDTRIGVATTNNGKIAFNNLKLPNKTFKLYVQEINAGSNYVLDTTKHEFTYTPKGNNKTNVIDMNLPSVTNKLAKANVRLFKFDKAQHLNKENPIEGVTFTLYGNINGREQTVGEFTTDQNGFINVNNLPVGAYRFVEKAPLAGYEDYTQSLNFNINLANNGQTIQLKAENKRLPIEIGTKATFENGAKTSNPYKTMKLTDTISYKNLIPGKKYIWYTSVVDAKNPTNIIAQAKNEFKPTTMNGTYKVNITVDGSKLRGKDIVFFEELHDGEETGYTWSEHKDPSDKGQTVTVRNPQIGTKAAFVKDLNQTEDVKISNPFKSVAIDDVVSYKDLEPNKSYTLHTKLVNRNNPEDVIIEASQNFTPKQTNGTEKVTVTVDGTKLRGKQIVFYEYLTENNEEMSRHENPKDDNQTVAFTNPSIGTQATFDFTNPKDQSWLKVFTPFSQSNLKDVVAYQNLVPNRAYTVHAKLVEVGNAKNVIKETTQSFTPSQANGTVEVKMTVDATKLRGKKVVFLEYLSDNKHPDEIIAKHDDENDNDQTVTYRNPKIGTQAAFVNGKEDTDKIIKEMNPYKENQIVDQVAYTNLTPNREYTLKAKLVQYNNANKIVKEAEVKFTPTSENGTVNVPMTVDGSKLRDQKVVFLEYLFDAQQSIDLLAKHDDAVDENQTVRIRNPRIGTSAAFVIDQAINNSKEPVKLWQPFKQVQIADVVSFKDLTKGHTYTVKTSLVEVDNPENVIAVKESTFKPTTTEGTHKVVVDVDGTTLRGKKVVFFEELIDKGEKLAEHKNPEDENQTVEFTNPTIGTQAQFDIEKPVLEEHLKLYTPFIESKLVDTVKYENLIPGREYTLHTKLVEVNNPENVIRDQVETFVPTESNGEYKVHTLVDGSVLRGKKVVFLEYLSDSKVPDETIAKHDDDKDNDQSVTYRNPSIGTQATFVNGVENKDSNIVPTEDEETAETNEDTKDADEHVMLVKDMNPFKENNIKDIVSFKDLTPGKTYRLKAKLVRFDKADDVLKEAEITFTPETAEGEVEVPMTINGTELRGEKVVFLEYLYDTEVENDLLAKHDDATDENQSVRISNPEIGTKASFLNGSQSSDPFKKVTVNDIISYKDVVKGRNYKLVTKLVKVDNPEEVVAEKATAFTPENTEGETTVSVEINADQYRGQKLVFFEYLYDQEKEEELLSKHEDKEDENQTVTISNPQITTLAKNKEGNKLLNPNGKNTIVETAEMTGLIPGNTYKVIAKGAIRKAGETNFTLTDDLVAEKEFVAEDETMTIEFEFELDANNLYEAVISFEEHLEAVNENKDSEEIAEHNTDHTVEEQSVTFDKEPETPEKPQTPEKQSYTVTSTPVAKTPSRLMQTGAKLMKGLPIIGVILVMSALGIIIYKRKFATANQAPVNETKKETKTVRKVSTKKKK